MVKRVELCRIICGKIGHVRRNPKKGTLSKHELNLVNSFLDMKQSEVEALKKELEPRLGKARR